MTNLVIDIGNSRIKAAYARGSSLDEVHHYEGSNIKEFIMETISGERPSVIALSAVKKVEQDLCDFLKESCDKLIIVSEETKYPIVNKYQTPWTLGSDRICAAAAAASIYPGKDLIIFNFGTALTIDFVSKNSEFTGGNISPGLRSRLRALNDYTQQLPLVEPPLEITSAGLTTRQAIGNGVILGLIFEINGYMREYPGHIYIFTGGDAIYFAEKLKCSIFVVYNLVLMGLALVADDYAKAQNN